MSDVQGRAAVRPVPKRGKADSRSVAGSGVGDGWRGGGTDELVVLNGGLLGKRGRGAGQDTQQVARRCMIPGVGVRIVTAIVGFLGLRTECHGRAGDGAHKQGE